MDFSSRLTDAQAASGSLLCVGLDPDLSRLPAPLASLPPAEAAVVFCREVIRATRHAACAYKPNLAFFEALGPAGWSAFEEVASAVPTDRLLIADAKRGDIGNTARLYARAFFDRLRCDAVTVSPYMGRDAIEPFLEYDGRCVFTLVLTSNPGAGDVQTLEAAGEPIYRHVARLAAALGERQPGTTGFVVGATRPDRLAELRRDYPRVPFLVPGVGSQGGEPAAVTAAAGSGPLIVNASRAVLYASAGEDYAEAAGQAATALRESLRAVF
jgi:orotidine-5'-phosphate decarboxylase